MRPDSIPELKGKAAREFEEQIRKEYTPQQKWVLKEAVNTYRKVKSKQ
jgi:hypothetical protein